MEWGAIPFSRGSSQPRDRTWSSALWADSLPSEPPGKPIFKVFIALVTISLLLFYVPFFFFFGHEANGVLVPQPGIELPPPALALAIAWPGKSLQDF